MKPCGSRMLTKGFSLASFCTLCRLARGLTGTLFSIRRAPRNTQVRGISFLKTDKYSFLPLKQTAVWSNIDVPIIHRNLLHVLTVKNGRQIVSASVPGAASLSQRTDTVRDLMSTQMPVFHFSPNTVFWRADDLFTQEHVQAGQGLYSDRIRHLVPVLPHFRGKPRTHKTGLPK